MGAESRLRQRHREAIRAVYPSARVVSQPASVFTGPGRTDFYVVVGGRYVGLELKTGTGRATPVQLARIAQIRRAGGYADVVRHPDQSLALIRHAIKGGSVWDNIFDEESQPEAEEAVLGAVRKGIDEIRAFKEPQVREQVEYNGVAPSGEGTMIEPPADYPFAVIIQRLDEIRFEVAQLRAQVSRIMAETGITPLEQEAPAQVASPAVSAASSPTPRSRSKKSK